MSCTQPNSTQLDDTSAENKSEVTDVKTEGPGQELLMEQQAAEIMVYVTKDGDKYHTADCRYSKTAHEIKFTQAKADGKTACHICKPSSTTGEKQIRCESKTGEGIQCKRMTTDPSGKCFQHRDI